MKLQRLTTEEPLTLIKLDPEDHKETSTDVTFEECVGIR